MAENNPTPPTKTVDELQKDLDAANERATSQEKTIKHLKKKLTEGVSDMAKKLSIVKDSEGNQYKLISKKFKYNKKEFTLEMLQEDPAIVDALLANKIGVLKAVK